MIEQNEQIEGLHPDGNTKASKVAKLYDVSIKTLIRWADAGNFPQPYKPNGYNNYFRNSDLLEYNERFTENETV